MKAVWKGETLAASSNTVVVEGNNYFPPDSVSMKHLKPGQPILTVNHLKRKFGDRVILKDVSFSLQPGDRVNLEIDLVSRYLERLLTK